MGPQQGPRASIWVCLIGSAVVPSRFGDESYQAGEMSKIGHMAHQLSGLTDSESPGRATSFPPL